MMAIILHKGPLWSSALTTPFVLTGGAAIHAYRMDKSLAGLLPLHSIPHHCSSLP